MSTGADHPVRRNIRLSADSYKQNRAYFVTICTHEKQCLLSSINGQSVALTKSGEIVRSTWLDLRNRFSGLMVDEYIVMPNHLHGILCFVGAGLARPSSAIKPGNQLSLINVMRVFKSVSTVGMNRAFRRPGFVLWQRSYFDHIIRTQKTCKIIGAIFWKTRLDGPRNKQRFARIRPWNSGQPAQPL
jgi:putative transposase